MKRALEQTQEEDKNQPNEEVKANKHNKAADKSVKLKVIMIAGYNGTKFFGSQKQSEKDIRTVEGEIEKALFAQELIYKKDFGNLKRISFNRATRTDKKVHALQNFFCCKLRANSSEMGKIRDDLKKSLPEDIRLFALLRAPNKFNTKRSCSSREYLYYLPSFCMQPLADKTPYENCCTYRIEGLDVINKVTEMFKGTNKFHNYTQGIHPKMGKAQRYIMEFKAERTLVVEGLELIEFFIKGQSFLYNQIRKMIGMVTHVLRKGLPIEVIKNSFKDNLFITPLAPGDGLMLQRVCYDHYNKAKEELSLIHICRCRRIERCRSRWSPYH
eukprot:TRINITY_DN197_c0_g3_i14.p1 TRINITY_DN197_c0_g3~~TRINITY_DN197_c0_g3_i14.p1  ORF type:complete len:328 (-),score=85.39 TRINITY_DN197_c0_g3_i14:16-999(-)